MGLNILGNATVTKALADELKLRLLSNQISEHIHQKQEVANLCNVEIMRIDSSDSSSEDSPDRLTIYLEGWSKGLRKRMIFGLLAIACIRQLATFFLRNRSVESDDKDESYLIFPSLSNPQFLLSFSVASLCSNLPPLFSANKFINKVHLLMLYTLHRFSVCNTDRKKSVLKTGIGIARISQQKSRSICERYHVKRPAFRSFLIMITNQKQLHFVSHNEFSISDVVVWDKKEITKPTIDPQVDCPFESYKFTGRLSGRLLRLCSYYSGDSIVYSKRNFSLILSQLISIQQKKILTEKYSIETTLSCLRRNWNTLGLSARDYTFICEQVQKTASLNDSLFMVKPQHGDFIPRNIILRPNGDLAIIDNSNDVKTGFSLTDVSTLIFSFLAGEPSKTNADRVEFMLRSRKFTEMKRVTIIQFNLTDYAFLNGIAIGLVEKLRICEIEGRASITQYWAQILQHYLTYFLEAVKRDSMSTSCASSNKMGFF